MFQEKLYIHLMFHEKQEAKLLQSLRRLKSVAFRYHHNIQVKRRMDLRNVQRDTSEMQA